MENTIGYRESNDYSNLEELALKLDNEFKDTWERIIESKRMYELHDYKFLDSDVDSAVAKYYFDKYISSIKELKKILDGKYSVFINTLKHKSNYDVESQPFTKTIQQFSETQPQQPIKTQTNGTEVIAKVVLPIVEQLNVPAINSVVSKQIIDDAFTSKPNDGMTKQIEEVLTNPTEEQQTKLSKPKKDEKKYLVIEQPVYRGFKISDSKTDYTPHTVEYDNKFEEIYGNLEIGFDIKNYIEAIAVLKEFGMRMNITSFAEITEKQAYKKFNYANERDVQADYPQEDDVFRKFGLIMNDSHNPE